MNYVLDTHTHTIASGHAYSSMREMAKAASEAGLEALGITDHSLGIPGACHEFHFNNLRIVKRQMYDIELFLGAEINIMDIGGRVDLPEATLRSLDIVIASIHPPCYTSQGIEKNTAAYVNAIRNPLIHIIGHPDDGRFLSDYEVLAREAKEHHTLLEINNSSLAPGGMRQNCMENAVEMLKYCKKYGTSVAVGSDAHVDMQVGEHEYADLAFREADFPEELIINRSVAELKKYTNKK